MENVRGSTEVSARVAAAAPQVALHAHRPDFHMTGTEVMWSVRSLRGKGFRMNLPLS